MTADPDAFRIEVLLSLQRPLWDLVTPALRGVAVRPSYRLIGARFVDEAVGVEEHEITAEAESSVVADFMPPVDVRLDAVAAAPDEDRELEPGEEWVYRREPLSS